MNNLRWNRVGIRWNRVGTVWYMMGSIMVIFGFPGIAGSMFLIGTLSTMYHFHLTEP